MAKPNYSWEKRQRELARNKKKEEKNRRKLERRDTPVAAADDAPSQDPASGGTGDASATS